MRVYEEYASAKEKREAQKGATRAKPTGKARGYVFTFPENGHCPDGSIEGLAPLLTNIEQGVEVKHCSMASSSVSYEYLRERCRRVGRNHLPNDWKKLAKEYA